MFGLVAHGDQVGSVKGFRKATALQAQRQYILNLALSAALTDPPPGDRKIFNRGSVEVVLVLLTSCSATAAGQPRSKHQAVSPDTDGVCDVWSWMSLRTRRHLPTRSRSLNQHHRWPPEPSAPHRFMALSRRHCRAPIGSGPIPLRLTLEGAATPTLVLVPHPHSSHSIDSRLPAVSYHVSRGVRMCYL